LFDQEEGTPKEEVKRERKGGNTKTIRMDEIEKTKTGVYDAQSLLAEANSFPKIKSRQLTSHEREKG